MPSSAQPRGGSSIRRMGGLILLAIMVGIGVCTATMLTLVDHLSEHFGPEVRADLEWRTLRGATELALAVDLGIAMGDGPTVEQAFGPYADSADVLAIVAVDNAGTIIAHRGEAGTAALLFAATPGTIVEGPGFIGSWAPVTIEGAVLGKVAIAVSTARLTGTRSTLANVSRTTVIAGIVMALLGIIVIVAFTRAVASRDAQLNDHATNLERRVDERTRELDERNRGMRIVLDNVAQGFLSIDTDGVMASERSAIVTTWFGAAQGITFAELIRPHAPSFAAWFDVNLDMIRAGYMPLSLCLAQLPRAFTAHGRSFAVSYSPIMAGDRLQRLLVIVSDVTEQLGRARAERDQHELLAVFQRVGSDRHGCETFLEEAEGLIASLKLPSERALHDRALHTLKGNCGMFGFDRFAELCHLIEGELREGGDAGLTDAQRLRIGDGWDHVVRTVRNLLGPSTRDVVEIERGELAQLAARAQAGIASSEVATILATWEGEPIAQRFERFGQEAASLARRLGKPELEVAISAGGVRLDARRWAPLWAAMVHTVRNAVDHGIEPAEARRRAGKGPPRISFSAAMAADQALTITVADDGAGVDWEAIRGRARSLGLAADSRRDLVAAMFAAGVSTRETATDTSGRGVGLAALQAAVTDLGGTIDVTSTPGAGTCLELRFPHALRLPSDTPAHLVERAA